MNRKISIEQQHCIRASKFIAAHPRHICRRLDNRVFPVDPTILVRPPSVAELPGIRAQASLEVRTELADIDQIAWILDRDPRSLWVFDRGGVIVGGFAMLFLSRAGVTALHAAAFNFHAPSPHMLASRGEVPAGIYWWVVWGRSVMGRAIGRIVTLLKQPEHSRADLWAVPFTESGYLFAVNLGFAPFPCAQPSLLRYSRSP